MRPGTWLLRGGLNTSITVETALVFPVFLIAVLALCLSFVFECRVYCLERSLLEEARNRSVYGCVIGEVLQDVGITSSQDDDSFTLSGSVSMTINIPGLSRRMTAVRSIRYRAFSGHEVKSLLVEETVSEEEENTDRKVYITDTGTVYHLSSSCSSLRLSISAIDSEELSTKRNLGGAKYYACEYCTSGRMPELLYITEDGTRYHYSLSCRALKRTITEISLSEAGARRACKRCAASEN